MNTLSPAFIARHKQRIEQAILPAMRRIYAGDRDEGVRAINPDRKQIENIVAYYDYHATGISVLAHLSARGDGEATELIKSLRANMEYYRDHIYMHPAGEMAMWKAPLRRLLLHVALAYKVLAPAMSESDKRWYAELVDGQVTAAIEHCKHFLPGETDLHLHGVNNHTAVFMQGVYYCGKVFGRPDWTDLAHEFAKRYLANGHPDGYFEEFTNEAREGGPSLTYTRLTAGCLFDVLDGRHHRQDKFLKAGRLFRSLVNHDYALIPIADERTNLTDAVGSGYGLALHALTAPGRRYVVDNLESLDYSQQTPETLAVIHHELDLMETGECATPENREDGTFRLTLPLGIIRKNGFTAGTSALRALNRVIKPDEQYAIDQQNMAYLAHKDVGVILTGVKARNNPAFSTFRLGDDAYTIKTGDLQLADDRAQATLYYQTFTARLRWEITGSARLILSVDTDQPVTTSLPIRNEGCVRTTADYRVEYLDGYSPYTKGNRADRVKSLTFRWTKQLVIDFVVDG